MNGIAVALRIALGLVGLGCLGAGGLAVYYTSNEAGTAALVIVGSICVVLSALGRWPSRVSVGAAGFEFERQRQAEELSEAIQEVATPEVASSIQQNLALKATSNPDLAFLARELKSTSDFERLASQFIVSYLTSEGFDVERPERPDARSRRQPDLRVRAGDRIAFVDFRRRIDKAPLVAQIALQAQSYVEDSDYVGGAVLSQEMHPAAERDLGARLFAKNADRVQVFSLDDVARLSAFLRRILEI
jgi:hypothetical protein